VQEKKYQSITILLNLLKSSHFDIFKLIIWFDLLVVNSYIFELQKNIPSLEELQLLE
jgi:hypothetical protein